MESGGPSLVEETDTCTGLQQATADLREAKLDGSKYIYVCVMPYMTTTFPLWFSVYSIPVKCLVPNNFVAADPSSEDFSGSTPRRVFFLENQNLENQNQNGDVLLQRSFICLKDKLYVVGGWMFNEVTRYQYGLDRTWDSKSMCLDFSRLPNVTHSLLQPMNCGKTFPILAEIGGLIFALPGPPFHFRYLSEPCFEVYDPSEDSWSPLIPPPFLDTRVRSRWEIERSSTYKYVVIKDKLYVSTDYVSYAYDMEEERWETCQLFSGFRHPDDFKNVSDASLMKSLSGLCQEENGGDATEDGGPPFAFIHKAILYDEDVLICVFDSRKPLVVAYQIDHGKVTSAQLLCVLDRGTLVDALLDLGRGFICCQFRKSLYSSLQGPLSLSFLIFWVSKLGGDGAASGGCRFLQFKEVHQSTQEIKVEGHCTPVYSFSL